MSSSKQKPTTPSISLVARHANVAGGLEKQLRYLAAAFVKRDLKVDLLTAKHAPPNFIDPRIQCHVLTPKKGLRFQKPHAFDRASRLWHKKNPHTIIFGIDRITNATCLRAGNGVHRAYLKNRASLSSYLSALSSHLSPRHRALLSLEKKAFTSPTLKKIFTNSEMVKEEILMFYPKTKAAIQVIHNGVEWNELKSPFDQWQTDRERLCQTFKLNPSHYHFLFIGHGFRRKGLALLINAFAALPLRDCHLSIIGGDQRISLFKSQCQKLNIANKVTFFGPRQDVTPFYALSDCLVIPSLYDPFANVTVEALAMGLYVVSSPFNGGKEVLTQENGTIIETLSDKDALIASLNLALTRPKTKKRAACVRASVEHLKFDRQLTTLVKATLATTF